MLPNRLFRSDLGASGFRKTPLYQSARAFFQNILLPSNFIGYNMAAPRIWLTQLPRRISGISRSAGTSLQSAGPARDEFAIRRPCIPPVDSDKICVCGIKYQIIDCQLNPIYSRTPIGLRNPDACAVLRFNMLIISAIMDIVAHTDFSRAGIPCRGYLFRRI